MLKQKLGTITQNTLIPIGLASAVVVAVVSLSVWFGSLATRVEAMESQKSPSRDEFKTMSDSLIYIQRNMVTKSDLGIKVVENK